MCTWPLKGVPKDVKKLVLKRQGELKSEKGVSQYSIAKTIYQIVRENHKKEKKIQS